MASLKEKFDTGVQFHQRGNFADAERIYTDILAKLPRHFEALHLLGLICVQTNRPQRGIELIREAIAINPNIAAIHSNLANVFAGLRMFDEAIAHYDRAIALEPNNPETHNCRAGVMLALSRPDDAIASCDRAIAIASSYAEAYCNRGAALHMKGRVEDALVQYDLAVGFRPNFADAYFARGNALAALNRLDDAVVNYSHAIARNSNYVDAYFNRANALAKLKRTKEAVANFDKVLALQPNHAEACNNRGVALRALERFDDALASYDRAIAIRPDHANAHNNRANVLRNLYRPADAVASCDRAIELNPAHAEAFNNRGIALTDLNFPAEAIASFDQAIAINPSYAEAYVNRAGALEALGRHSAAIESYDRAIALAPDFEFLPGNRLRTKMKICDWGGLDDDLDRLIAQIMNGERASQPFAVLAMTDSPAVQKMAADIWVDLKYRGGEVAPIVYRAEPRDKIRIGYFSADYREHAIAYLVSELIELHDRSKFEIFGFSYGPPSDGPVRDRLTAAFDSFIDIGHISDADAADLSRRHGIDIAVDLTGFTEHGRTSIFAHRAAPVQVNYLGYPGTMGADYFDYLIADRILIPELNRQFYAEKIVHLPNCYQVNDRKRPIADKVFSRAELGLPDDGFVFCCFNNNYKIMSRTFDIWMRILSAVENSVLWLFEDNMLVAANLRREAERRGISGRRLVFAQRMARDLHLARHRAADLFLDTLPYNAHTTASDALWAGLPVLTYSGESFAGRVAASLLHAIDVPELIAPDSIAYEALAIALAADTNRLSALRDKIQRNRLSTPLFDTPLFTRHIESAFLEMHDRWQKNVPPEHICVNP